MKTGTVTGTLLDAEGLPLVGRVRFTPYVQAAILDTSTATLIIPKPTVVTLDATGSFSVDLVATDDPDLNPTGWTYGVQIKSAEGTTGFAISVPALTVSDLSTIVPIPDDTGTPTLIGPAGPPGPQGPPGEGSSTPEVFFSAAQMDLATVPTQPKGAFQAVQYPAGSTFVNIGGGTFNTTTWGYTIPVTGLYMCVGSVRRADGVDTGGWYTHQNIGTAISDQPYGVWSGDTNQARWTWQYSRLAYFTAGDVVYQVFRGSNAGTGSTTFNFKASSFAIGLVR